jgi:hypothetical protein
MKKLLVLSLGALALVANLTSCKKGENDPFLSLSSRKARLAGEWTVTKETRSSVDYGTIYVFNPMTFQYDPIDAKTVIETLYDGTVLTGTQTQTSTSGTETDSYTPTTYTETYSFEKDGTFTHTVVNSDASQEIEEGIWMFTGKNKDAELKKKEAISLSTTKNTNISPSGISVVTSSTGFDGTVIRIDQLKKKEIVFVVEYSDINEKSQESTYIKTTTLTLK